MSDPQPQDAKRELRLERLKTIGAIAAAVAAIVPLVILLFPRSSTDVSSEPAAALDSPLVAGQVWRGQLTCSGYPADIVLDVSAGDATRGTLRFDYGGGVRGAYEVEVELGPDAGQAKLNFTRWVEQPTGLSPVNLVGRVEGSTFAGTIADPACTEFELSLAP